MRKNVKRGGGMVVFSVRTLTDVLHVALMDNAHVLVLCMKHCRIRVLGCRRGLLP